MMRWWEKTHGRAAHSVRPHEGWREHRLHPAWQREIVRRVDALFALVDGIESRVAAATARAERLTQSIPAKAFRGELVPTEAELARREGRDYEPASCWRASRRSERTASGRAFDGQELGLART